jgi:hypothetical protein
MYLFTRKVYGGASRFMFVFGTIALLSSSPAFASEDYCLQPGTHQIHRPATQSFQLLERQSNRAFMRRLSGVWLSVTVSQPTNQISYLYESFSNTGLYGYTNYVCTLQNEFCRQYVGTGLYAVRAKNASAFFGIKDVSDDVGRDHACIGLAGRFVNRNTWVSGQLIHRRYP